MAKSEPTAVTYEPTAHISWPRDEDGKGPKLSGDYKALALGTRCRVVLEGTCKGFSMGEYGGSIDLKVKTVLVDSIAGGGDDDEAVPMTALVEGLKKRRKG